MPLKVEAERTYIRDGRAPIPKDPRTSAVMSRIRAKNTGPERMLRVALTEAGHAGYRLHWKNVPGRPDLAWPKRKVAVFVHGCFWHGCPYCEAKRPKSNKRFWNTKLDKNKERDARKVKELRTLGWRVLTIWECRLKKAPAAQVARVKKLL
jgi:DNA mismatch endonuclease, patch repair protein